MNREERMQIEHHLYITGLCLPCVGVVLFMLKKILPSVILAKLLIPCLFHTVTGLYCPGCGGTRAVKALLEGEILLSFFYHPIVPYCAVLYVWFMLSHTIERLSGHRCRIGMHYRNFYIYLALAIVVINIAVKDIALTAFHIDILKILENPHTLV